MVIVALLSNVNKNYWSAHLNGWIQWYCKIYLNKSALKMENKANRYTNINQVKYRKKKHFIHNHRKLK